MNCVLIIFNRLWCGTCKRLAKPKCHEEKHRVSDFVKDVNEFDGWIVEMETDANQGVGKGLGSLTSDYLRSQKVHPKIRFDYIKISTLY